MTSRVLYSAQYQVMRTFIPISRIQRHIYTPERCVRDMKEIPNSTFQSFEPFEALYMHNHDDKYPARSELEPGTSRLQALVDTTIYFY